MEEILPSAEKIKKTKPRVAVYQNIEYQLWKQEKSSQVKIAHSSELPQINLIDEDASSPINGETHITRRKESDNCLGTPAIKNQIRSYFPSFSSSSKQDSSNSRIMANDSSEEVGNIYQGNSCQFPPGLNTNPQFMPYANPYQYQPAYAPMYIPVFLQPVPSIMPFAPIPEQNGKLQTGRLKFFDDAQNYGFFVLDSDGSDLFVHYDELLRAGLTKDTIRQAKVTGVKFAFQRMSYYGKYNLSHKAIDVHIMQEHSMNYAMPGYVQ